MKIFTIITPEVVAATMIPLAVILFLVFLIYLAEKKLLPDGDVQLLINDDMEKSPIVKPGSTLLSALSSQNIFIPSACGGGGTCAMCKCQILEGGGDILPTEISHFSRSEVKDNWRLSCQVKVRNDMKIQIPEEIFNVKKWECTVLSNHNVATFIKELILKLPEDENLSFKAGGYVQIEYPEFNLTYNQMNIDKEYHEDWDKFNLWDLKLDNEDEGFKAFSMANHPAEGNIIKLNVRVATPPPHLWNKVPPGVASSYIFNLKPNDKVTISGPYGEFFIKDTNREKIYIGGGAGMAPLRSHLFHLFHTENTKSKVSYWYGARSLREMFYDDDFQKMAKKNKNFNYNVALSDALPKDDWKGYTGFIHQVLYDNYLKGHEDPTEVEYYMCGPPPMINAVKKMLHDLGVEPEMIAFDDFGE